MLTEKEEIHVREGALVRLSLALQLCREALLDVRLLGESEVDLEAAINALDTQIDNLEPESLDDDEVPEDHPDHCLCDECYDRDPDREIHVEFRSDKAR